MNYVNNKWLSVSLTIRCFIAILFLLFSLIHLQIKIYEIGLFLLTSLIILHYYGAISFQKSHGFILIPLFFMYFWLHFLKMDRGIDWLLNSLFRIIFFYIFVLLITQGVKIFEWIYIFRNRTFLNSCVLALACAFAVLDFEHKKSLNEKYISRKNIWIYKPKIIYRLFNSISDFFILGYTMANDLHNKYVNWHSSASVKIIDQIEYIKLHDVYEIPIFFEIYKSIFDNSNISKEWINTIGNYIKPNMKVLEIGAGTGRFTKIISRDNIYLVSIESNKELYTELKSKFNNIINISVIEGFFPQSLPFDNFNIIILHQNVFIELVNQFGLSDTCSHLKKYLTTNGYVILDYVDDINLEISTEFTNIINDTIENIGEVEYKYKVIEKAKENISGILNLIIRNYKKSEDYFYESQLKIEIFDVNAVIEEFHKFNFALISKEEIKDIFTFFPGKMLLLIFTLKK